MKEFNVKSKRSSLFAKGITALSLSLALQGRACLSQSGTAGHIVNNLNIKQFQEDIQNKKDITLLDEKGRTILFAAVKHDEPEKVQIILDQYKKDNESGVLHKYTDFTNFPDPVSKNTPLIEAIKKGNIRIFNILTQNEYISINRASNGITPLVTTFKNGRHEMANTLLKLPNIDIKTKDPTSGNTVLHLAIKNKWTDTAIQLIDLFKKEELYAKNKKDKTLLHTAACANKLDLFQKVLHRLIKLSGIDEVIKQLFEKTKDRKTVWEYIYLSKFGAKPVFSNTNIKMFEYAINTVKDNLTPANRNTILEDINRREHTSKLKGGISKDYADTLRNVVHSIPTGAAGI